MHTYTYTHYTHIHIIYTYTHIPVQHSPATEATFSRWPAAHAYQPAAPRGYIFTTAHAHAPKGLLQSITLLGPRPPPSSQRGVCRTPMEPVGEDA